MEEDHDVLQVPISALQHYSYCPRQCALIHQEQSFEENALTLRGRRAHRRVESGEFTVEDGVQVLRSLPLYSKRLGLVGKADVVEILPDGRYYPVEYKHGRRHHQRHDDLQLAAQALCLEEMTGQPVPEGAIYHHKSRRRRVVHITPELRQLVEQTTQSVRRLLTSDAMPAPLEDDTRCRNCSLQPLCEPRLIGATERIHMLSKHLFEVDDAQ